MTYSELTETYLMVHRDLKYDPVGKAGEIGKIISFSVETDDYYMQFDDSTVGLYAGDALLLLKPCDQLFNYIEENPDSLSLADLNELKNIAWMEVFFISREALTQAAQNEYFQKICLITLEDRLLIQPLTRDSKIKLSI